MEKTACNEAGVSNGKEVECTESIIDIPVVGETTNWPGCCIYRIPKKLREVNEKAYTPKIVSIGPFHHDLKELKAFERHKKKYLEEFRHRTGKNDECLESIIWKKQQKIRHCYSETFKLKDEEFVKMFVLDAAFITELFLRNSEREKYEKLDYILSYPWLEFHLKQDLILLENQLPYKFLQKFYYSAFDGEEDSSFFELACKFFFSDGYRPMDKKVEHFTDLQRARYRPTKHKPQNRIHHLRHTATKLDEAGVGFEKVELDWSKRSLLDIDFEKNECLERFPCFDFSWLLACLPCLKRSRYFQCVQCVLKVPELKIDVQTEALLRNLMALEQCHYPLDTYICNYVILLDSLITTKADVRLLVDKKVVVNGLGSSKAVTTLINRLGQEIVEVNNCYFDLHERLIGHCDSPWNSIVASLRSVYFRDFWRGTATIAGIMVLCFTFWNFLRPFVM